MTHLVWGLLALGLGIVFAVDCVMTLDYAVWLGYVGLTFATVFINDRRAPWLVAGISTALIFIGAIVSPSGASTEVALINRSLGVALLWIAAASLTTTRYAVAPIPMLGPDRVHSDLAIIIFAPIAGLACIVALLFWQLNQMPPYELLTQRVPGGMLSAFFLLATIVGLYVSRRISHLSAIYTKALRDKEQKEEELRALSEELEKRMNERTAGTAAPQYGHLHPERKACIPVLLVDDHAMVRQGLRSVMEGFPDIEIVGEASNGHEAVKLVERRQPAVVLMDINMPKLNGVEATAKIKTEYPHIAIIGLSVNAESGNQEAMKKAGAAMLLPKEAIVDELYTAILSVSGKPATRWCPSHTDTPL